MQQLIPAMLKAPASSGIQCTSWSSSEAATLIATLTNEKAEGQQAESGFKAISYKTTAADQLRIHVKVKSIKQCQDHWKKVLCSQGFGDIELIVSHSSKMTSKSCKNSASNRDLDGTTRRRL
jgi:hypothetical protein